MSGRSHPHNRPRRSRNDEWPDRPDIPLWLWLVIYAVGIGLLGVATAGVGTIGRDNDDGCYSTVSAHQGCFP
jgi:hypothetical protein